jgi:Bacterial TSP3 repeat
MANRYWADRGTTDTDKDGLSDEFERDVLGTDPNLRDTDGDKVNDLRELDFGSSPLLRDSDGDEVDDYREVIIGTNPQDNDTDHDRFDDRTEIGRSTATAPDSDGDGTPDWLEFRDSDGDLLGDLEERWLGTKPDEVDSDLDANDDWWELATGREPRTPEDMFRRRHPPVRTDHGEQEWNTYELRATSDAGGSAYEPTSETSLADAEPTDELAPEAPAAYAEPAHDESGFVAQSEVVVASSDDGAGWDLGEFA